MVTVILVTGFFFPGHTGWTPGNGSFLHSMGDDNAGAH
jgi:hypothetical protein